MSDKVIIFVADDAYLPHYKSVAVNCRRQGEYDGDFAIIVPDDMDVAVTSELRSRSFHIMPTRERGFFAKFEIFSERFRPWKQAIYLDADVIVQLPLQSLFDQLSGWPCLPSGVKPILACREEVPVFMGWQIWDKKWDEHRHIYEEMATRFPYVFSQDKMWNTAVLLFEPESIAPDTVQKLHDLQEHYHMCNVPGDGGTDEQIIDLLLHNQMAQVANKGWCYWGLDEEASRVPSLARGWVGGEIPAIVHYTRWYAQWLARESEANAYYNDRIGRVCCEFYRECLDAFDTVFPRNNT